jgi:hypothetical protein
MSQMPNFGMPSTPGTGGWQTFGGGSACHPAMANQGISVPMANQGISVPPIFGQMARPMLNMANGPLQLATQGFAKNGNGEFQMGMYVQAIQNQADIQQQMHDAQQAQIMQQGALIEQQQAQLDNFMGEPTRALIGLSYICNAF